MRRGGRGDARLPVVDLLTPSGTALQQPLLLQEEGQPSSPASAVPPSATQLVHLVQDLVQRCARQQLPEALYALGTAVREEADLVAQVLQGGVASTLQELLDTEDAEVAANCCFAVHSLATGSDKARRTLGTKQMMLGIVGVLRRFPGHETVKQATWVIRNLALLQENRMLLKRAEAHMAVLEAVRQAVAESWDTTIEPVAALMALAAEQTVLKDLRGAGVASVAKSTLDLYSDPSMLADCIGMIYNLAFDLVLAEQLQSMFICESILGLMDAHTAHRGVQLAGIRAIGSIASNVMPDSEYYRNLGVHARISTALQAFPKDGQLKFYAQATLDVMSDQEDERRRSCVIM